MTIERVERVDDERLADYVGLTDVALRSRREPELGLYLAESDKVIRRALDAGHRPRSLLLTDKWLSPLAALVVNFVAAVTFLVVRPEAVDWAVVGLVAVGSLLGGAFGARVGRALPPAVLRAVVAFVGVVAIVRLVSA